MTFASGSRVHFIGVGGAGMSAIAKVLLERGHPVTGSDLKRSRAATILEAMGASVHIGHDDGLIDTHRPDYVVVSSAIPGGNPELKRAQELGIQIVSRGEALAGILEGSRSLVVAGTHGKTTTTSMVVSIARSAGLNPTYLVGGGLNDVGTNARSGTDDLAVAESDESDGSFLLLSPHIAVLTNVEPDHLDYWKSAEEVTKAFERFLERVDPAGAIVLPLGLESLAASAAGAGARLVTFGAAGTVRAEELAVSGRSSSFVLVTPEGRAQTTLHVPGLHNVANATAAAAACIEAGMSLEDVAKGIESYRGVERRFQIRGEAAGVTVIDDYAHHPTEVKATLSAARPGPWSRVVAVFQPHRYSRTKAFQDDFGKAFADADRVVVTDVYGAGEQPEPGVSGKLIADSVCRHLPGRPVAYLPHRGDLAAYLEGVARPGDALFTLGAGDITTLGDEILQRLGARR